jgi:DNA-binding XRE family transcriptional regulator
MDRPTEPRDDLDAYLSTLDDTEHGEIAAAEAAIDIAVLLYRAREHRGLSQSAAAARTGLAQQAISRIERPNTNVQLATLQKYLGALGYDIEIVIKEPDTGEIAARTTIPAHAL